MARDDGHALAFPEGSTLHACGPDGVAELAGHWREARYPARAFIVSEEESDDDVFFVLSGRARAATYTNRGREVFLSELPAGEAFGIFAAIDGQPRSTNVIAVEESRIARMTAASFRKVLFGHADVNRAFVRYLVERIRWLSSRVTSVTTLSAEQRLISELLRLAGGERTGADSAVIDPVPTQQELALLLFSQREAIGRDMSKLREAGLIERRGRTLVIRSLAGLRARLEAD
ncbi:MAG TPA: Crp/Fnr family transcriptional regulator [Thermohalobaculum sp.]|nr:Crp/Fnr family transcriptional regulator [Thermohalobaculum sp.]